MLLTFGCEPVGADVGGVIPDQAELITNCQLHRVADSQTRELLARQGKRFVSDVVEESYFAVFDTGMMVPWRTMNPGCVPKSMEPSLFLWEVAATNVMLVSCWMSRE